MMKAIIVGAGRIGVGGSGFSYSHLQAYRNLEDRVSLVAVVEKDKTRRIHALQVYNIPTTYEDVRDAVREEKPDIVSICTPPEVRTDVLKHLTGSVKGVWCEKPYAIKNNAWPFPVQVNYIRRFDPIHRDFAEWDGCRRELFVIAKKDCHTVCHFTDLARFWNISKGDLHYYTHNGPNSYILRQHFVGGIQDRFFPLGGITDVQACMDAALGNLLDVVNGDGSKLLSDVPNAIESERWAEDILLEY